MFRFSLEENISSFARSVKGTLARALMAEQSQLGYDDTPVLPGQRWRVHDRSRPQPRVVAPGAQNRLPPSDAIVLFDGCTLDGWLAFESGQPARWKVENGHMEVVPGSGDIRTQAEFGDCQLHVEFAAPNEVAGTGQQRGNSGVFLMARYEIQVLDCYENPTYPDGTSAAIYGQYPPLVNACRPPGDWQMYDVVWIAPRFEGSKLVSTAHCTVFHNGVLVHYNRQLLGPTSHRILPVWSPHPPLGPLRLQDHGDPVRFRNIWYRPLDALEM
jgi:hypothetical protein